MIGYYMDPQDMYTVYFPKCFHFDPKVLDNANNSVYQDIERQRTSIAIHVRRGDLSSFNPAYGNPVTISYFLKSISLMNSKFNEVVYYFFSDEQSWVQQELIPQLPELPAYKIVSINGSDKGYMDMLLISACTHQITSKGSLGKFGGFINCGPSRMILVYDDEWERRKWDGFSPNIMFVKG